MSIVTQETEWVRTPRTFGELVEATSVVAEQDAPAILAALFASGRAWFRNPGAIRELESLSRRLPERRVRVSC